MRPNAPRLLAGITLALALTIAPVTAATAAAPGSASAGVTADVTTAFQAPIEKAKAKKYKNCTQLRKTYKGGVAKPGVKGNKVGSKIKPFKIKPKFSTTLYKKNRHLDRDKDGIACEA